MNPQAQGSQHQPPTLLAEEMNGQDAGVDCHSPSNRRGAPPLPQNVWKHPLVERAIFLLLLTLLVAPVYAPALNRFLAADQLYYFAELKNDLSLANGLRFLDYNAVRGHWKGDQACYRPLLFAWQALGSSLCGYNYRAWNSANLAFHLLVAYLLFELLRCIQPTVFAGAFALVFSVLTKNCELVMWNHLGGYLLGYAMLLLALLAVQKLPRLDGCQLSFWLAVYALSISTAMLFYEMAVISAVLLIGYACWRGKEGGIAKTRPFSTAAAFFVPLLLFAGLYLCHLTKVERLFWVGGPAGPAHPHAYPTRMLLSLWFWTCGVFDPWYPWFFTLAFSRFGWTRGVFCLPSGKLLSVPDDPTSDLLLRGIVPVLLFGGGLLFCFRHGLARGQARARLPFTILLFLVLLAYSSLTNLGRSYALRVTYYTYFFSLISAVLVYSLVDFSRLPRRAAVDALALLTLLGAVNARQSFCLARQVAAENADVGRYAARIGNFVNKHRDRAGLPLRRACGF